MIPLAFTTGINKIGFENTFLKDISRMYFFTH